MPRLKVDTSAAAQKRVSLDRRVKKLEKKVRRNEPEAKYIDSSSTSTTPSSSGVIFNFNYPAQGDGDIQRDGDTIFVKYIDIKGYGQMHPTATSTVVRMVALLDKGNNVVTVSSVMDASYVGTGNLVNAPYDHDNRHLWGFKWDKRLVLDDANGHKKLFSRRIMVNKHVQFNNIGATAIVDNYMRIIFMSSESTNTPTLAFSARLHYTDA